jgi:hypothetical protein
VDHVRGEFSAQIFGPDGEPRVQPYSLLPTRGEVFMVEDAAADGQGHVFDGQRLLHAGGCEQTRSHLILLPKAPITEVAQALQLTLAPSGGYLHRELLGLLPLLFQARRVVEQVDQVALLVSPEADLGPLLHIFGWERRALQVLRPGPEELIAADRIFVPAKPPCGQVHYSLWGQFREFFFFESPLGRAIMQRHQQEEEVSGPSRAPAVLVVTPSGGGGQGNPLGTLPEALERAFASRARITQIREQEPFERLMEAFSGADLVLGLHSKVLAFAIFMPERSGVVEAFAGRREEEKGRDLTVRHLCNSMGFLYSALEITDGEQEGEGGGKQVARIVAEARSMLKAKKAKKM